MALTPTTRLTNVRRTIASYVAGLTLTDTPTVLLRDDPRRVTGAFLRLSTEFPGGAAYIGRWGSTQAAFQSPVLAIIDLFWPVADTSETSSLWSFSLVVDELRDAFLALKLGINDYSVDPSSPTVIDDAYIDFTDPEGAEPRTEDGYRRTRITCRGRWIARHTIARS